MESTRSETGEKSERQDALFLITVSRADFITCFQGAGTRHQEMWKPRAQPRLTFAYFRGGLFPPSEKVKNGERD